MEEEFKLKNVKKALIKAIKEDMKIEVKQKKEKKFFTNEVDEKWF